MEKIEMYGEFALEISVLLFTGLMRYVSGLTLEELVVQGILATVFVLCFFKGNAAMVRWAIRRQDGDVLIGVFNFVCLWLLFAPVAFALSLIIGFGMYCAAFPRYAAAYTEWIANNEAKNKAKQIEQRAKLKKFFGFGTK